MISRRAASASGRRAPPRRATRRARSRCAAIVISACTAQELKVSSPSPLRRACHAAGVVGKSLYLVGGRYWDVADDDYIFLNDIQVLDMAPESTFASDWRRYYNNELLSDVTLVVEDTQVRSQQRSLT